MDEALQRMEVDMRKVVSRAGKLSEHCAKLSDKVANMDANFRALSEASLRASADDSTDDERSA
jgi:hypothetical protein